MALEKVRDILKDADARNASVIAFDAMDYPTISSAIYGAQAVRRPVILMLYPAMDRLIPLEAFAAMVRSLAAKVSVPVGLHLDHCSDFSYILSAIRAGFTSVMADGSTLPFSENVAFTSSVVAVADAFDVDVEGELGHVGQANAGDDQKTDQYTTAEEARIFAGQTGVASLAVAIGSAHGFYTSTPKLAIDRLEEINQATDTPLVLHGGSGIPHEQLEVAFRKGINKFNVGTEFFHLNQTSAAEFFRKNPSPADARAHIDYVRVRLQEYIEKKLLLTTWRI